MRAAIVRLAKRPQGVTNPEVVEATGARPNDVGSRLAQMVRTGMLRKEKARPTRFYLTEKGLKS